MALNFYQFYAKTLGFKYRILQTARNPLHLSYVTGTTETGTFIYSFPFQWIIHAGVTRSAYGQGEMKILQTRQELWTRTHVFVHSEYSS